MKIVIDSQNIFDHIAAARAHVDAAGDKLLDTLEYDMQVMECGATDDNQRLCELINAWNVKYPPVIPAIPAIPAVPAVPAGNVVSA